MDRAQGHRPHVSLTLHTGTPREGHAAPPGLLPEIAARWKEFWGSEFSQLVDWDRDQDALRALYRLYDLRRRLEVAAESGVFVAGSQEQPVLNPALRQITTVDAAILAREQQFGLTPKSAAALGLTIGALKRTVEDLNREANERAYGRPASPAKRKAT
jgi:terminase small subunit-like protein